MRICILGATGLVGQETLDLVGRAWPDAELGLYASRSRAIEHRGKPLSVLAATELEASDAPSGDLALVALDDTHSKRFVPRLLELGYRVVDKSNTYRMDPEVPLCVAGVNTELATDDVRLVSNPNCTTIPFTIALAPLLRRWGIASVTVSTYQAISGAGVSALDLFLERSSRAYLRHDNIGSDLDPAAYAGNVVPHAGKTDESGFSSEERKLMSESRKILGQSDLRISAQCCRVPVAVGHYENVWLTLDQAAPLSDVAGVLGSSEAARHIKFFPGAAGEGLSALACVHDRDRALVGRLRRDPRDDSGKSVCMTIVGDNLRVGAATNAIRIASRWFACEDPELQEGVTTAASSNTG